MTDTNHQQEACTRDGMTEGDCNMLNLIEGVRTALNDLELGVRLGVHRDRSNVSLVSLGNPQHH